MSNQTSGANTSDDINIANIHAINAVGKETKYVNEQNFGYSELGDDTDVLRVDSKRNWTEDTLSGKVAFSNHSWKPSSQKHIIEVSDMSYNPLGRTSYLKRIEIKSAGSTTALHASYFDGVADFGVSQREDLKLSGRFTAMNKTDWYREFLSLLDSAGTTEQRKKLVNTHFRNEILNLDHAKYVIYGTLPGQNNNNADEGKDSPDAPFGDPEFWTTQQLVSDAIIKYENAFGPIDPVVNESKMFKDSYINLPTFFNRDEMESLQNMPSPLVFDIDPVYSFYETMYEETTKLGVPEVLIPNMYVALQATYEDSPSSEISTLLTLGALAADDSNFLNSSGEKSDTAKLAEEYWRKFGEMQASTDPALGANTLDAYAKQAAKSRNLGVLSKDINYLKDYNDKVNRFPMAAKITFSSQNNLAATQVFQDANLDYPLMKTAMFGSINRLEDGSLEKFNLTTFIKSSQFLDPGNENDSPVLKSYAVPRGVQVLDINNWLDDFAANGEDYFNEADADGLADKEYRFLGQDMSSKFKTSTGTIAKFLSGLSTKIVKQKIKNIANKRTRSYADILKGKSSHQEILMYKLSKHAVVDGDLVPSPIQNIYFMNSNEISDFVYNDTQVVYGQEYKYVVYAYTLVFGTEYKFSSAMGWGSHPGFLGPDGSSAAWKADFHVFSRPSVELLEIPYYGLEFDEPATAFIFDDPPMPPNVDLGGYRGINNKLHISLSNNFGSMITEPVALEDVDNIIFENARRYQSLPKKQVAENKIRFESDDPSAAFQIFRVGPDAVTGETKKPVSYFDFRGKKIKTIDYPDSDSASYIDRLRPNVKYYYIFRTIDVHGNISNPTVPYEVELVSEPGSKLAYVIVREHDFTQQIKPKFKKPLRRYLHVDPREHHKQVKINSLEDIDVEAAAKSPPPMGIKQDSLFLKKDQKDGARLKKFKIRLTSRRSGKKVDINVKFIHEHDKLKKA